MNVTFVKTGERRYRVEITRDRAPDLWVGSIGYDDYLPHDLLHFVAEAEFGLDGAVFGDLAAGGNARIFIPFDKKLIAKMWRANRRKHTRLPDGRRSEELAWMLEAAWKTHRRGKAVGDSAIERLLPMLDELAERWHGLQVGGSMTLSWPRPERRHVKPAARPQRKRSRHGLARSG
jgi:hypothetical protein